VFDAQFAANVLHQPAWRVRLRHLRYILAFALVNHYVPADELVHEMMRDLKP